MSICKVLFLLFRGLFISRGNLILENLALRQQLTVQQRTIKRPKLKNKDRTFWSWLSQIWPDWKSNLTIVKPETVIKWHRQGFKLYWRWKSQSHKVGRPKAFPYDSAPKYLIRDRDKIFGNAFVKRVRTMQIEEVLIAPKSPWQNPYCERVIGSIRRECLDHCIILSENHLYRILKDYTDYYNNCRTHLSLKKNSPEPRNVEKPEKGRVVSIPKVSGLHHLYKRVA